MKLLDIDMLRRLAVKPPRVHGNGFIQLDLPDGSRLNFWGHPNIPRQKVKTDIHDHVFSFSSELLWGTITHFQFAVATPNMSTNSEEFLNWGLDPDFEVYHPEARHGEDTRLIKSGRQVQIMNVHNQVLSTVLHSYRDSPKNYYLEAGRLHRVVPREESITHLRKVKSPFDNQVPDKATVLIKTGEEPDNEFDRHGFDECMLWDIIETMLITMNKQTTWPELS